MSSVSESARLDAERRRTRMEFNYPTRTWEFTDEHGTTWALTPTGTPGDPLRITVVRHNPSPGESR